MSEKRTLHAFVSHAPAESEGDAFTPAGGLVWGDTLDWEWYADWLHPRAAEVADSRFAEGRHIPGVAAYRLEVAVPAELNWDDEDARDAWIDDVEWEHCWVHPAVTAVRANDFGHEARRWQVARNAAIATGPKAA